ncbi:MAG TPA: FAD-binding protein [Xanthobacteraceae bacterium]|jgi:glycolate oxidase FAD binding subunit|nr:FAD-binding protein [Xanthobacteraceae bacterium]
MADSLKPRDAIEVEFIIRAALAEEKTLEVIGRGTKRAIGRAAQWDATVDLSGLSGVTLYEPEELVLSAKAGTPLAEIEALVAGSNQELAFEPMDYGPLFGNAAGGATIGGVIAANLSGPRRIKAGAARDHFLGVNAVSGRGEVFKSGGRVVKNVTGYDLCKVIAGSWGTLAVMTDVTVKTLPKAETEASVLVLNLDDAAACDAMAAAMGSYGDVSAAAHLPVAIAQRIAATATAHAAVTAFRLEGVAPSVAQRKTVLEKLLAPFGSLAALGDLASRALWRSVRDVLPSAAAGPAGKRDLWRISTAPSAGAAVGRALAGKADAEILYDWAGGLVWAALPAADDANAPLVRATVAAAGGHATLIRAPAAVRAAVDVFSPEPAPLAALTERIRKSFDPQGVLNPGRMWAGV